LGNSNESFEIASETQQTNFDMRHKIAVGDRNLLDPMGTYDAQPGSCGAGRDVIGQPAAAGWCAAV
jgi:hypothetical protein